MSNKTSHSRAARIAGLNMRDTGHTELDFPTWRVENDKGESVIVYTLDARMPRGVGKVQRVLNAE